MHMRTERGYHVKITAVGKPENVWLFNKALGIVDNDWPYKFLYHEKRDIASIAPKAELVCSKCGGVLWKVPRMLSKKLRGFARQFGVNAKVRSFGRAKNCAKG